MFSDKKLQVHSQRVIPVTLNAKRFDHIQDG